MRKTFSILLPFLTYDVKFMFFSYCPNFILKQNLLDIDYNNF